MLKTRNIFVLLIILILVSPAFLFKKVVSGKVIDCATQQPIKSATVTVNQRGWGKSNGQIVWDKDYVYTATTDKNGNFRIEYSVGSSANLTVKKEGYLWANQWESPKENIVIGLMAGNNSMERTYHCKLSAQCIKKRLEGKMEIYENVCQ